MNIIEYIEHIGRVVFIPYHAEQHNKRHTNPIRTLQIREKEKQHTQHTKKNT